MLAFAMGIVAIDVDLPAEDDAETYADFTDRRQCLAWGETADLAEAPCTLDVGGVEKRKDLVAARLNDRRMGNAHASALTNVGPGGEFTGFWHRPATRSGSTPVPQTLIAEDDAAMVRRRWARGAAGNPTARWGVAKW